MKNNVSKFITYLPHAPTLPRDPVEKLSLLA